MKKKVLIMVSISFILIVCLSLTFIIVNANTSNNTSSDNSTVWERARLSEEQETQATNIAMFDTDVIEMLQNIEYKIVQISPVRTDDYELIGAKVTLEFNSQQTIPQLLEYVPSLVDPQLIEIYETELTRVWGIRIVVSFNTNKVTDIYPKLIQSRPDPSLRFESIDEMNRYLYLHEDVRDK